MKDKLAILRNSHLGHNLEILVKPRCQKILMYTVQCHALGNQEHHLKILDDWIPNELTQIIHTFTLAKMGILNTAILDLKEINQIIKAEGNIKAPLMQILEHATFKILYSELVYVLLIIP